MTPAQRRKRLGELRETILFHESLRGTFQRTLIEQEGNLRTAEVTVTKAVVALEQLKLDISLAPAKLAESEKILTRAQRELSSSANIKLQRLIKLREQVEALEGELRS